MTTSKKEDSASGAPADDARAPSGEESARADASSGADTTADQRADQRADRSADTSTNTLPPEVGGQKGPEPTRYGDWEKKGRCTDF